MLVLCQFSTKINKIWTNDWLRPEFYKNVFCKIWTACQYVISHKIANIRKNIPTLVSHCHSSERVFLQTSSVVFCLNGSQKYVGNIWKKSCGMTFCNMQITGKHSKKADFWVVGKFLKNLDIRFSWNFLPWNFGSPPSRNTKRKPLENSCQRIPHVYFSMYICANVRLFLRNIMPSCCPNFENYIFV